VDVSTASPNPRPSAGPSAIPLAEEDRVGGYTGEEEELGTLGAFAFSEEDRGLDDAVIGAPAALDGFLDGTDEEAFDDLEPLAERPLEGSVAALEDGVEEHFDLADFEPDHDRSRLRDDSLVEDEAGEDDGGLEGPAAGSAGITAPGIAAGETAGMLEEIDERDEPVAGRYGQLRFRPADELPPWAAVLARVVPVEEPADLAPISELPPPWAIVTAAEAIYLARRTDDADADALLVARLDNDDRTAPLLGFAATDDGLVIALDGGAVRVTA
jgi:hypothetical protein